MFRTGLSILHFGFCGHNSIYDPQLRGINEIGHIFFNHLIANDLD